MDMTIVTAKLKKYPDLEIHGCVNFRDETDCWNVEITWNNRLRIFWEIPYLDAAIHQLAAGMMEVYNAPQEAD